MADFSQFFPNSSAAGAEVGELIRMYRGTTDVRYETGGRVYLQVGFLERDQNYYDTTYWTPGKLWIPLNVLLRDAKNTVAAFHALGPSNRLSLIHTGSNAADCAAWYSDDGGLTWVRCTVSPTITQNQRVIGNAYVPGISRYFAVDSESRIHTSTDAITWSTANGGSAIAFAAGTAVRTTSDSSRMYAHSNTKSSDTAYIALISTTGAPTIASYTATEPNLIDLIHDGTNVVALWSNGSYIFRAYRSATGATGTWSAGISMDVSTDGPAPAVFGTNATIGFFFLGPASHKLCVPFYDPVRLRSGFYYSNDSGVSWSRVDVVSPNGFALYTSFYADGYWYAYEHPSTNPLAQVWRTADLITWEMTTIRPYGVKSAANVFIQGKRGAMSLPNQTLTSVTSGGGVISIPAAGSVYDSVSGQYDYVRIK